MKIISIIWLHSSGVAAKRNLIFSSSCTVYGQAEIMPITKMHQFKAMSPYGNKTNREEIITDVAKVTNIKRYFVALLLIQLVLILLLRWVNYLGVPQNLVPFITQTGFGLRRTICLWR
jgi:UDP-glucose 4-epimerase